MFMKRPKHKDFDYIPKYYDPDRDPELKRRERYKFRSNTRRGKRPPFLLLLLLFLAVVVILFVLAGK